MRKKTYREGRASGEGEMAKRVSTRAWSYNDPTTPLHIGAATKCDNFGTVYG
jgi:hypothetical protein